MTSKPIKYNGHTIEVLRYPVISPRNGRETEVRWSAKVDGKAIMAYTVWHRSAAIQNAKDIIDMIPREPNNP